MRVKTLAAAVAALALSVPAIAEYDIPALAPETRKEAVYQEIDSALVSKDGPVIDTAIYDGDDKTLDSYTREEPIFFGAPEDFTSLEGITTFRGSNYRDNAAYGTIGAEPSAFGYKWSVSIGGLDKWTGVGWTGQCSIVRWPEETRRIMNLYPEKKEKPELTEVIYATLDGHIYFLDLDDGTPTRDAINIGAPIKGSLSVDPRGWPLLYCGQGIDEVNGRSVKIGTRIFSLIDGSVLYFINGHDGSAYRHWYAFDAAPLIDARTDTMLQVGENGIFYTIKLNTVYDPEAGTIAIAPETVKYGYRSKASSRPGMENSVAVFSHYACFAENSGLVQCVDINTMELMWGFATGDDTDSTIVLENTEDGVALYTACELDQRGNSGACHMRRLDALTGKEIWCLDEMCKTSGDTNGGAFATPALGKASLSKYIYFHIARTSDGGTLLCVDKETGEVAWRESLKSYGWSSPVCVYADTGRGYVAVASSSGKLRLFDGLTGEMICDCDLKSNVEGSPTVFGNTLVVGTRGEKIVAVTFE